MSKYSEYKAKYYQQNKARLDLKTKEWVKSNPDSKSKINANYVNKNKDKVKSINSNWYESNKDRKNKYSSKYKRLNKSKINNIAAKYRAAKLQATPSWLTKEQLGKIEEFYILAQEMAWLNQDGKPFHVDHIVPLQGVEVCGLHVPWNLQLLTESLNCSKSNKSHLV